MTRKLIGIGILSMLFITSIFSVSVLGINTTFVNASNTIYIDDDNTQGPWDGTQEHPYQYIQDGIDNAKEDDTIFVCSGIYKENIEIYTRIVLQGENQDTTIIDGNKNGGVVSVQCPTSVRVAGFTITNGIYGLQIFGGTYSSIICDNIIKDNSRTGILLADSYDNIIRSNIIKNNGGIGINLDHSDNNIVSNDAIMENDASGIDILGDNNIISDNTITNNGCHGIILSWGQGNTILKSNNNTISSNTIKDNYYHGIHLFYADENSIKNNVITNNNRCGILLFRSNYNNITKNTIKNNPAGFIRQDECKGNKIYDNDVKFKSLPIPSDRSFQRLIDLIVKVCTTTWLNHHLFNYNIILSR